MRIIKAAKKTDEYITTCDNCGSTLGVKVNDLSNNTMKDNTDCNDWCYYCSVCQCRNHIIGLLSELFPWKMEDEDDRKLQSNNSMRVNTL